MTTDWSEIDNRVADHAWYASDEYRQVFKRLRDEDPVHWVDGTDYGHSFWLITRYADVKELLFEPTKLSNRMSNRLPRAGRRLRPEEKIATGFDINISSTDDPMHNVYRRPVNKHFSIPAIGRMRADIAGYVDEMIREVADLDEFDVVDKMCAELPLRVVLRLLGVPTEDWEHLKLAANQWGTPADPRYTIDNDPVKTALIGNQAIGDYCVELAKKRRENPQDDFATVIGNLKIDGDLLTINEMRVYFFTMIAGGLETTRNAASSGVWAFLQNPDQCNLLRDDPSLIDSAVEEVMRWVTPARKLLRINNDDMDYGGKRLRANDWVLLELSSANWDERQFTEPERFDIRRTPNEHFSLGTGIHACLGRALVRLELAVFFPKVFAAFPEMEAVDPEPHWIPDVQANGQTHLIVRSNRIALPV